jgi:Na+/phosphate symporter
MNRFNSAIGTAITGGLVGVVIAEFFPRLFQSGLAGAVGNALSDPFSSFRNDLAVKYGLAGLGIGLVVGIVISLASGRK